MKSVEVANEIKEQITALGAELEDWTEKGKKVAAKRARKITLTLEKQFKVFRKQSVLDTK